MGSTSAILGIALRLASSAVASMSTSAILGALYRQLRPTQIDHHLHHSLPLRRFLRRTRLRHVQTRCWRSSLAWRRLWSGSTTSITGQLLAHHGLRHVSHVNYNTLQHFLSRRRNAL